MKASYSYRTLIALSLVALLGGCGDDEKKTNDPQPRLSRTLKVHYNGQNLATLGAHIDVVSKSAQGVETPFVSEDIPENNISETKPAFTVPQGNDLTVTIKLSNVPSGQRAPNGTVLVAQLLSEDVVVRTIQIDKATAPTNGVVMAKTNISASEW